MKRFEERGERERYSSAFKGCVGDFCRGELRMGWEMGMDWCMVGKVGRDAFEEGVRVMERGGGGGWGWWRGGEVCWGGGLLGGGGGGEEER